jgi:acetolactate synthase-1/2/3 large subunit
MFRCGDRFRLRHCRKTRIAEIADAISPARTLLIVTPYLGHNDAAVKELMRLRRDLGVGVLESAPSYMNYPHDDACYLGNYWNEPIQNPVLAEADVILVIDCDAPWIPSVNAPSAQAAINHLDVDPLKESIPLRYIKARCSLRATLRRVCGN